MNFEHVSNIQIDVHTKASDEIKKLLASTIYGIKGKLQYRHLNPEKRIEIQEKPFFITIKKYQKLLGTVGFMERITKSQKQNYQSYYIRYLSIPQKRKEEKRRVKSKIEVSQIKKGIKSDISNLIEKHFTNQSIQETKKSIFYAYVDQDNAYSQQLCATYGYEKTRKLSTIIFSRVFPKKSNNVKKCTPIFQETVSTKLDQTYFNYNFYHKDTDLTKDHFVYIENHKPVAGIKATPVEWGIVNIPGFTGFVIQYILPFIPFISRLFNAKRMKFMAFEAAWADVNYEHLYPVMMESICAENNMHVGMIWLDSNSPEKAKIAQKLGLLSYLKKDIPADILVRFNHFTEQEKTFFLTQPAYIAASDLT